MGLTPCGIALDRYRTTDEVSPFHLPEDGRRAAIRSVESERSRSACLPHEWDFETAKHLGCVVRQWACRRVGWLKDRAITSLDPWIGSDRPREALPAIVATWSGCYLGHPHPWTATGRLQRPPKAGHIHSPYHPGGSHSSCPKPRMVAAADSESGYSQCRKKLTRSRWTMALNRIANPSSSPPKIARG